MPYDTQYSENGGPSLKCALKSSTDFLVNFVCASAAYLLTRDEHSSPSPQALGR